MNNPGTKQEATAASEDSRGNIVFYVMNPKEGFSGGRYHAWMVAEAASEAGWNVSIITTNLPPLAKDFEDTSL